MPQGAPGSLTRQQNAYIMRAMTRGKISVAFCAIALMTVASLRTDRRDSVDRVASVRAMLRAINSAEATFASTCGRGGYAGSLHDLATPPQGSTTGFIVDAVPIIGYTVTLEAGSNARSLDVESCSGVQLVSSYFAHADPLEGLRLPSFATDQRGLIYARDDGVAIDTNLSGTRVID
jgi:hypothetical protein